jgi:hypothetical protein
MPRGEPKVTAGVRLREATIREIDRWGISRGLTRSAALTELILYGWLHRSKIPLPRTRDRTPEDPT